MMRTRTLVLFSSAILVAGSLHAQLPRIVLQGSGGPQVFTDITEALTAAQPNDKLYFSGGTFSAPLGITVDKPLHFIGAGIHPDSAKRDRHNDMEHQQQHGDHHHHCRQWQYVHGNQLQP
jgi:hypothetical protein